MTDSIDRRSSRTRRKLSFALMDLAAARDVEALSVGELAREAGVGRSTFYAHYAGKDDFIFRSFAEMIGYLAKLERDEHGAAGPIIPHRGLLAHFRDAKDFVARMSRSDEFQPLLAIGEARLRDIAAANLAARHPKLEARARADAATFLAAAFMGLARAWIATGMARPVEDVCAAFERLSEPVLAALAPTV